MLSALNKNKHMKKLFLTLCALSIGAGTYAANESDIVTILPEGIQAKTYLRNANSVTQWGASQTQEKPINAKFSTIARTDDGKIYIGNALSDGYEGYLVGTVEGNVVTFSLPQAVSRDGNILEICRVIPSDTNTTYVLDENSDHVSYTFDGENLIMDEGNVIGFIKADGKWNGYAETRQVFSQFNYTVLEAPEGGDRFDLALAYEGELYQQGIPTLYEVFPACQKENKLYIQGFSSYNPDNWVVANIDGDKVIFEGSQYLGSTYYGLEFLCPAKDTPEWIPGYETWEHHYALTPSLTMAYDAETRTLTALDKNDVLTVNYSPDTYNYGMVYINPCFKAQPEKIALKPVAPLFDRTNFTWMNGDSPLLTFQIQPLNIDGDVLDKNRMGAQIYMNDKLYTFDEWTYWLDSDITTIPWCYNASDIAMMSNGYTSIYFAEGWIENLSIKAVYTDTEGKEWLSDATYVVGSPTSSVDALESVGTMMTEYYDLTGKRVFPTDKGIKIRRDINADGTSTYTKIF